MKGKLPILSSRHKKSKLKRKLIGKPHQKERKRRYSQGRKMQKLKTIHTKLTGPHIIVKIY